MAQEQPLTLEQLTVAYNATLENIAQANKARMQIAEAKSRAGKEFAKQLKDNAKLLEDFSNQRDTLIMQIRATDAERNFQLPR